MLVVGTTKDFHVFNVTIFFDNLLFLSAIICSKVGVFFSAVIFFNDVFLLSGVICFNGNNLL